MSCLSFQEGLILIFVAVVVFGAGRLPQIGDGLGRAIRNFRRAASGENEIDVTPKKELPDGQDAEE